MTPTRLLLPIFLLGGVSLRETNAFSRCLLVPGTTIRPVAVGGPSASKSQGRWPSGRRRSDRFYREHKALAVPFSGTSPDLREHSWEDIMNPAAPADTIEHNEINALDKFVMAGALVAAILSAYSVTMMAPGSWRFFAAGAICAATSHAIPTPIDVVKTRKQVDPALAEKTFVKAAHEIIKEEGMSALWAGLGPTAFGYLLEGAVKFGTYEILKPVFKTFLSRLAGFTSLAFLNSRILAYMLCGAAAGVAASIMLCPMEAIRIRMVSEPEYATGGWLKAGYRMLKQEGVGGLCKGINPMIMKQVPYTVTKNVSFDILTRSFYATMKAQGMTLTASSMFVIPLLSAAAASIFSTITSQPGDMVLSLVNAHKGNRRPIDIFKDILNSTHGIRGFFVGFKTRLLHVGVTVTIQLIVYDYVKRLCGIAATGTS